MLLQRPALRLIAAAALLVICAQSMLDSILGIWALNRFGFGPRTVGLLIFCVAVLAVLMQGGLVRVLVPRLGEPRARDDRHLRLRHRADDRRRRRRRCSGPCWDWRLCGMGVGAFTPSASALASKQSDGARPRRASWGRIRRAAAWRE